MRQRRKGEKKTFILITLIFHFLSDETSPEGEIRMHWQLSKKPFPSRLGINFPAAVISGKDWKRAAMFLLCARQFSCALASQCRYENTKVWQIAIRFRQCSTSAEAWNQPSHEFKKQYYKFWVFSLWLVISRQMIWMKVWAFFDLVKVEINCVVDSPLT